MTLVERALAYAWQDLQRYVAEGKFSLCEALEDEITEKIQDSLGRLHAAEPEPIEGFSQLNFNRDGKVRNCDGKHLDRQPDLAFYPLRGVIPTTNTTFAAIFVECKPVDANHAVRGEYCEEGLARFIRGDYAWAVDRALMVGYVRNRCSLPGGLLVCIDGPAGQEYGFCGALEEVAPSCVDGQVFRSVHLRACGPSGRSIAPITLDHLWLYPSVPCESSRCRGDSANRAGTTGSPLRKPKKR